MKHTCYAILTRHVSGGVREYSWLNELCMASPTSSPPGNIALGARLDSIGGLQVVSHEVFFAKDIVSCGNFVRQFFFASFYVLHHL